MNDKVFFDRPMRLIAYYNMPIQTMEEETKYIEAAGRLADLLQISFTVLSHNNKVDPIFRSLLTSNAVFILRDEDYNLYAYYPHKNIARITKVIYNKRHSTPVPYIYKSWFVPGQAISVKDCDQRQHIHSERLYTITTCGNDFLITMNGKQTLPLRWDTDTYISIKDLSELLIDSWVSLYEYATAEDCGDCDGYDYSNCDNGFGCTGWVTGDCEHCGERQYICNNTCFNHRYRYALKLVLNWTKITSELNVLFDILTHVLKSHEVQNYLLFNQYSSQLQTAYRHCQFLARYFVVADNLLGEFIKTMDLCCKLNEARETIYGKLLLTVYVDTQQKFCVNRDDVQCEHYPFWRRAYHLETICRTYNLISDSFVEFDYRLKFVTKDDKNKFITLFMHNKIASIYLSNDGEGKYIVGYIEKE